MNVKKGGLMRKLARSAGFTMIELLVVIAVIGILSVALLATLNPLEQIRKGRDTRTRSDSSQLISGLERYNASLGYFPWQPGEGKYLDDDNPDIDFVSVKSDNSVNLNCTGGTDLPDCTWHDANGEDGILDQLTNTNEVKSNFITRITNDSARDIYLYYNGTGGTGASVIACFMPESNTFAREAFDRCAAGSFSSNFGKAYGTYVDQSSTDAQFACPDGNDETSYTGAFDSGDTNELICIP